MFVRIFGSGSFCRLARNCSKELLIVFCSIFGTRERMDFSARSRTIGSASRKLVLRWGKMSFSTMSWVSASLKAPMFCSRFSRICTSFDANIFETDGTMCLAMNSSSFIRALICTTGVSALGGAPPYTRALRQAGSTFFRMRTLGSPRSVALSWLKNRDFSDVSLSIRPSRNSMMSLSFVLKNWLFCRRRAGFSRREGFDASRPW